MYKNATDTLIVMFHAIFYVYLWYRIHGDVTFAIHMVGKDMVSWSLITVAYFHLFTTMLLLFVQILSLFVHCCDLLVSVFLYKLLVALQKTLPFQVEKYNNNDLFISVNNAKNII